MALPPPGGPEDFKALQRAIARDAGLDKPRIMAQSLVSYASAPMGAKKYDATTLGGSSSVG